MKLKSLVITRGRDGMVAFSGKHRPLDIPIFGSDEVTDVTGAGDTVIATFTAALAAGATSEEAAHLANYAGGIVVMKRGTATVSQRELLDAIEKAPPQTRSH
jgi:bifunctional ADP-heptose synthase (sugar kinase/adenylyltransferase)